MKYLFLILIIFNLKFLNAQNADCLNIPLIGQIRNELCWAASMEMVTTYESNKYHSKHFNQCEIAAVGINVDNALHAERIVGFFTSDFCCGSIESCNQAITSIN